MRVTSSVLALWVAGGLAAAVSGCRKQEPPPTGAPPTTTASAAQPSAAEQAALKAFVQETTPPRTPILPPGHPPLDGTRLPGSPPDRVPTTAPTVALRYTVPTTWQREPVRSPLRSDQYRLPRAAGDAEDAELAVFGGIGGSVEDNVTRWRGQFTTPDGRPIPDEGLVRESFEVGSLRVTVVDLAGRYAADAMMAGGPAVPRADYRLLAAVVEGAAEPVFFKVVGPAETVAQHRADFLAMLRTLQPE